MHKRNLVISSNFLLRFFFIFLFICVPLLKASAAQEEEKLITLTLKDLPLENCLKEISARTKIKFVYGNEIISRIKITCSFKKIKVEEALKRILYPKGLNFKYTATEQITIFEDNSVKIKNKLSGIITDSKTGERLPYAVITIEGTDISSLANNNGEFLLQDTPSGSCIISVRRIGYNSINVPIALGDEQNNSIKISMTESEIMFNPVIINAENIDIFRVSNEAGTFTMSPKNNMLMPGIGMNDISRTLQSVPGLSAPSFGSSGLNIRGGIPSQNLILLDGISLYHMNHSFGFFNSFNSSAIKDVQIYKGGYPAKFGGRLAGVVELTSKSGDFNNFHIDAGANQMSAQGIAELPLFGKGAVLLSARRSVSGFVLNTLYEKVYYAFRENFASFEPKERAFSDLESDIYFYDLLGKITYLPTENDIVTLSAFSGFDKFENGRKETAGIAQLNENAETNNKGFSAKWYSKWSDYYYSTLLFSKSKYNTSNQKWWSNKIVTDTILVNRVNTNNTLDETTISIDNQLFMFSKHEISLGAAYSEISTDFNFGIDFIPVYLDNAKRKLENNKVNLFSFYIQDKLKLFDFVNTIAGLRINRYKESDGPDYEPRLSLSYNLSHEFLIKAAAGKYYQYVMQYEDFANLLQGRVSWISADNKYVKSSSAWHYILGAKYEKDDFLIDAELYYKKMYDVPETLYEWKLSERIPESGQIVQNESQVKGFDLLIKKKAGIFFGWISYSYCSSKTDYVINEATKTAPASNDTPHKFDFVINMKLSSLTLSAAWHYISGKPYSIPLLQSYESGAGNLAYISEPLEYNTERYPASHQLDLSVIYTYSNNYFAGDFGISIFNVYDHKNVWFGTTVLKNSRLEQTNVNMLGFTPTLFLDIRI